MTAMRRTAPKAVMNASHEFMAFAMDVETATTIEQALLSANTIGNVQIVDKFVDTIEFLSTAPTPGILMVDVGSSLDVIAAVEQLSEVCDPETRVVLLGEVNDLYLYRELIGIGIADYLIKPITESALSDVLQRLQKPLVVAASTGSVEVSNKQGQVIAIIGARGGSGASMIASNLALEASDALAKKITLIDMDLTFGTQAVTFDVDPGAGLSDAMMEPDRMDELFIKRAAIRIGDRLQLMAAETDPNRGDIASAEALYALLGFVRQESDYVIIDVPRSLVVCQPAILEQFDTVMLIAEPTLAAMRDCARVKTLVSSVNPNTKLSVVMNKIGIAGKDELPISTFEEGASLKIARKITFDPKGALSAEAHGKCVTQVAAKSKISKDLKALAFDLMGGAETKKRSSLGALFGLNKLRLNKVKSEER